MGGVIDLELGGTEASSEDCFFFTHWPANPMSPPK